MNLCSSLRSLALLASVIISLLISNVDLKAQICQKPVHWTVDSNGMTTNDENSSVPLSPMKQVLGYVSMVVLLKSSSQQDLQHASGLRDLQKALARLGVSDVRVIIINSRESPLEDDRARLSRIANVSSITVYQETEEAPVWDDLEGLKGDIFIYDKCGRMTYYLPTPLSIVSAERPFVQTSVLSTYFDKPCGEYCEDRRIVFTTESPSSMTQAPLASFGTNSSFLIDKEDLSGNASKSDETSELLSSPWRIFDFFLTQVNDGENVTSVRETKTLEMNLTSSQNETDNARLLNPIDSNEGFVNDTQGFLTSVDSNLSTTSVIEPEELSTFPTVQCDAQQCREFSTDSVLQARLCCLREDVGSDGESTTGCRSFSRDTCSQMLPLIKCCLKDFKELLANYFNSQSNGRKRKPSFAG